MTKRMRIDRLLVERGLFESRAKAQEAIAAGMVTADGVRRRPSRRTEVSADAALQAAPAHPWVSRGGVKLAAALDHFGIDPRRPRLPRRRRLDRRLHAGAAGARRPARLRGRCRTRTIAREPARRIPRWSRSKRPTSASSIRRGSNEPPDLVTVDVSFIPLKLVLPAALALARPPAEVVVLIKPQYEAGPDHVKKGMVRDPAVHAQVCAEVTALVASLGWTVARHHPLPDRRRRRQSRIPDARARQRLKNAFLLPRHPLWCRAMTLPRNHDGGHLRAAGRSLCLAHRDRRHGEARLADGADPARPDRHDDDRSRADRPARRRRRGRGRARAPDPVPAASCSAWASCRRSRRWPRRPMARASRAWCAARCAWACGRR